MHNDSFRQITLITWMRDFLSGEFTTAYLMTFNVCLNAAQV
jgi:hypothetical protein